MWYQELEEVIPEPKACFSHRLLSCIFLKFVSFTMLLIPVSSTIKRTFSPTSLCTDDSVLWIFCGFQLWNQEVCSSSDRCLYWHRMPSSWTLCRLVLQINLFSTLASKTDTWTLFARCLTNLVVYLHATHVKRKDRKVFIFLELDKLSWLFRSHSFLKTQMSCPWRSWSKPLDIRRLMLFLISFLNFFLFLWSHINRRTDFQSRSKNKGEEKGSQDELDNDDHDADNNVLEPCLSSWFGCLTSIWINSPRF